MTTGFELVGCMHKMDLFLHKMKELKMNFMKKYLRSKMSFCVDFLKFIFSTLF